MPNATSGSAARSIRKIAQPMVRTQRQWPARRTTRGTPDRRPRDCLGRRLRKRTAIASSAPITADPTEAAEDVDPLVPLLELDRLREKRLTQREHRRPYRPPSPHATHGWSRHLPARPFWRHSVGWRAAWRRSRTRYRDARCTIQCAFTACRSRSSRRCVSRMRSSAA